MAGGQDPEGAADGRRRRYASLRSRARRRTRDPARDPARRRPDWPAAWRRRTRTLV